MSKTKEFVGQREGEELLFIFRRHVVVARRGMLFLLVVAVIGAVPMFIWQSQLQAMMLVWVGFVLLGFLGLLYVLMLWHFSYYMVTDGRIRQVSQKGIFSKSVTDLELEKIESISYDVTGIFANMFGYGTILIQTIVGDMTISNVEKPEMVYEKIQEAINRMKEK